VAIKFETVNNGDVLYDCHKTKMGNTTMRRMGTWKVLVIEKDERGATVSWNGNRPQYYGRGRIERLRRTPYKPKAQSVCL
jgi:hypothetical protein